MRKQSTNYTPSEKRRIVMAVVARLANGSSINRACAYERVSPASFYRWGGKKISDAMFDVRYGAERAEKRLAAKKS